MANFLHAGAVRLRQNHLPAADCRFEQLSGGAISIYGHKASELPPWQRDVNTVFQDYALFPHMSILDNVAYGLMVKGIGKKRAMPARRRRWKRWPSGLCTPQTVAALRRPAAAGGDCPRW
jgi:ABC-type histidine transport system ATPase subunit